MSKLKQHRHIFVTAVGIQLLAIVIGLFILYSCTGRSYSLARDLSEIAYWGTIGVVGMMILGAPITLLVIIVTAFLVFCGVRWKKVSFLWVIGLLLWGGWWALLAYDLCLASTD